MAHLNWSKFDGAEFESLVHTLLLISDSKISAYGRPGPDHGMDALSGDKKHVYQAKFRKNMSMSVAAHLALVELRENIVKYRSKGDARYEYWKDVTDWTFVANLEGRVDNDKLWEDKVVREFEVHNIKAHCIGIEKLEADLELSPEVRESYFGGENRVFLSLAEVHRNMSLEVAGKYVDEVFIGQETQLKEVETLINDYAINYISVEAPVGMGKTRFLFECALLLSEKGYRVLWGRQDSMMANQNWSRSVNTARKTCVMVESISDARLVNILQDQLSLNEKNTWKVIASTTPDLAAEIYARHKDKSTFRQVRLSPLSENQVQKVFNRHVTTGAQNNLQVVAANNYSWTGGRPGWVFLMMALSRYMPRTQKVVLAPTIMEFASTAISGMFSAFDPSAKGLYYDVFRWVCLWRMIVVENPPESSKAIEYIAKTCRTTNDIVMSALDALAKIGLLCRWGGIRKYYVAEPELIRQMVLSSWLLEKSGEEYEVNHIGAKLVSILLTGDVPYKETILSNLSTISTAYLTEGKREAFISPILKEMEKEILSLGISDSLAIIELIRRIGHTCPERSLDILAMLRNSNKNDEIIDNGLWGKMTLGMIDIVKKLPDCVLGLARNAADSGCSRKCWNLMLSLCDDQLSGRYEWTQSDSSLDRLKNLIASDNACIVYSKYAVEYLTNALIKKDWPAKTETLIRAVTSVERNSIGCVTRKSIIFSRWLISDKGKEWELLVDVVELIKTAIKSNGGCPADRSQLWHFLDIVVGNLQTGVSGVLEASNSLEMAIHELLVQIFTFVLERMQFVSTIEEGVAARRIWEYALQFNHERDILALIKKCEQKFSLIGVWQYQEIIKWDRPDEKCGEIAKVAEAFEKAEGVNEIAGFFDGALAYIRASTPDTPDADCGAFCDIAVCCQSLFKPLEDKKNPYTTYVLHVLANEKFESSLVSLFAVYVVSFFIKDIKLHNRACDVITIIKNVLSHARDRDKIFVRIYSDRSEKSIGPATKEEFEYALSRELSLSLDQLIAVLPQFLSVDYGKVMSFLNAKLATDGLDAEGINKSIDAFVFHSYLTVLRKDYGPESNPISWIWDKIIGLGLDGRLLKRQELRFLQEKFGRKMGLAKFYQFVDGRIALEETSPAYEQFEIVPYGFDAIDFFENDGDTISFNKVCVAIVSNRGYFARSILPSLLKSLNPEGDVIAAFVSEYLQAHPSLTRDDLIDVSALMSVFDDSTEVWRKMASPLCARAIDMSLSRDDMIRLYVHLRPMTKSWCGVTGEIPHIFVDRKEATALMLANTDSRSPLWGYWKWASDMALEEYERAADMAEMERHE